MKRIAILLSLVSMVMGCMPRTPAETVADKQRKIEVLQHEVLCMKMQAGDLAAMAELAVRRENCLQ